MTQLKLGQHIQVNHAVQTTDLPFEFMMNNLRLVDGFNLKLFNQTTGLPISNILAKLTKLQKQNLIEITIHNHIRPTTKGLDYLNNILEEFLA